PATFTRRAHEGARASPGLDQARVLQLPVRPGHGVGGEPQVGGEPAHGRQPGADHQLAVDDLLRQLGPQLLEGRYRRVGRDREHHAARPVPATAGRPAAAWVATRYARDHAAAATTAYPRNTNSTGRLRLWGDATRARKA